MLCAVWKVQHEAEDVQKATPSVQLGDLATSTHLQRTAHSRYINIKILLHSVKRRSTMGMQILLYVTIINDGY